MKGRLKFFAGLVFATVVMTAFLFGLANGLEPIIDGAIDRLDHVIEYEGEK